MALSPSTVISSDDACTLILQTNRNHSSNNKASHHRRLPDIHASFVGKESKLYHSTLLSHLSLPYILARVGSTVCTFGCSSSSFLAFNRKVTSKWLLSLSKSLHTVKLFRYVHNVSLYCKVTFNVLNKGLTA